MESLQSRKCTSSKSVITVVEKQKVKERKRKCLGMHKSHSFIYASNKSGVACPNWL